MKKIIILISVLMGFILTSCNSEAGAEDVAKIKVSPTIIYFQDDDLYKGEETKPQILTIKNIGESDLKISKIAFTDLPADMEMTYFIKKIDDTPYENIKYPVILKKGKETKVSIVLIPREEGIQKATIEIHSNTPGKDKIKKVEVRASNFIAKLKVNEVVKSSGYYMVKKSGINSLKVKQCSPSYDQRTLINICNIGKATLRINDIYIDGDSLAKEYFEIEKLNTPAKLPGSYAEEEGICITGFAICYKGGDQMKATLKIENDSENAPSKIIRLEAE